MESRASSNATWKKLLQRYRASGLRGKYCLVTKFAALKMEPGEEPKKFMMRVDEAASELRQVVKNVDEDDKHRFLNVLTQR